MKRQKELAVKVMELANQFTHWNFQMKQKGDSYEVSTVLSNNEGNNICIAYMVREDKAQLELTILCKGYDVDFAKKKIRELMLKYPIYGNEDEEALVVIKYPMALGVLEQEMYAVVCERMVDMLETATKIANHQK